MKSTVLLIIASLLLAGCASTPPKASKPDACMILGSRNAMAGSDVNITFAKLDGVILEPSIWGGEPTSIETNEGPHVVIVKLTGSRPSAVATGRIQLRAQPGATYKLEAEQKDTNFKVSLFILGANGTPKLLQAWAFAGRREAPYNPFTAPIGDPGRTPRTLPPPRIPSR